MEREAKRHLFELHQAGACVLEFVAGRTAEQFEQDAFFRSAVERQMQRFYGALERLRGAAEPTAERVPHARAFAALGPVLLGEPDRVDGELVWDLASERMPGGADRGGEAAARVSAARRGEHQRTHSPDAGTADHGFGGGAARRRRLRKPGSLR